MIGMKNSLLGKASVLCASLLLGTSALAQSGFVAPFAGNFCASSHSYWDATSLGAGAVIVFPTQCNPSSYQCVEPVPGQAKCVAPTPTPVPAMDFTGLGILGLLSAGAGALALRRRKRAKAK